MTIRLLLYIGSISNTFSQFKDLKLSTNIKLLGELKGKELINKYKSSHAFILPSIYEGQPLTLLEAWAAKLPVIVTNTGDCRYLVKKIFG